ncbi:MAG: hypothetical protein A2X49_10560 [Lentisphaerae bacterium GWF2_52_8]|nr:MAG: hypothetical protein A2X49_10560 [Lentisphaerae bacterium GWF2_52_8]
MAANPPILSNPVYERLLTGFYKKMRKHLPAYRPEGGADCLLMLTLAGAGSIRLANGEFRRSGRGDVSIHCPRTPQWYGVDDEAGFWSMIWVHFHPRPYWLEWLSTLPEPSPGLHWASLDKKSFGNARKALTAMHLNEREGSSSSRDFAMNFLEAALLHIRATSASGYCGSACDDFGLTKAITAIGRSPGTPPPVPELAKIAGMSVSSFAHRFKAATGVSPLQYSLRLRLKRAENLLLCTPMTVKELALSLGFEDPFYFSRLFQKNKGFSPASWRALGRTRQGERPAP